MLRRFSTKRILFFLILDSFGSLGLLVISAFLRSEIGLLPQFFVKFLGYLRISIEEPASVEPIRYILPIPILGLVVIIWIFFCNVFSVYDGRKNETLKEELTNVFLAICVSMMTLAGCLFFSYREASRVMLVLFFIMDVVLLLSSRYILWIIRNKQAKRPREDRRPTLIIGAGPVGQNVAFELRKYAWMDIRVVGYIDDDPAKQSQMIDDLPVLGTLDQVSEIVRSYQIQEAIIALPLHAHERLVIICKLLQSLLVRVHVVPDLFALSFPTATLEGFGGIPVINLGEYGIYGWRRIIKRIFDVVSVTVGLVFLSPLFLLIAILIKLDSKGPVFFKQQRVGELGRTFTMFKFRSMVVDADPNIHKKYVSQLIEQNLDLSDTDQSSLKMEEDPRVTRMGKFLRKTSLDELPQLFNVLTGEMSLVGPRPPIVYEVDLYKDWHKRRLEAIPGITGLWQVKARNRVSFDEMVRLDLEYIQHQSLWLDISILLQTPFAVLHARGAG